MNYEKFSKTFIERISINIFEKSRKVAIMQLDMTALTKFKEQF